MQMNLQGRKLKPEYNVAINPNYNQGHNTKLSNDVVGWLVGWLVTSLKSGWIDSKLSNISRVLSSTLMQLCDSYANI